MNFFLEIWHLYRSYGVKILADFLVAATFWFVLYLLKLVEEFLPVPGWGAILIHHLHSAGAVFAFLIFTYLSVIDIYNISKKR